MKPWVIENVVFKHDGVAGDDIIFVSAILKETGLLIGWLHIPYNDQCVKSDPVLFQVDKTKWRFNYV